MSKFSPPSWFDAAVALLAGTPELAWAALFGSFAKGTEHAQSDVDIAVRWLHPVSLVTELALGTKLDLLIGREVDIVDAGTDDVILNFEIAEHAQLLWERDAGALNRFVYDAAKAYREEGPALHAARVRYNQAMLRDLPR